MNVFLLTDIEGVWNVTGIDAVDTTKEEYTSACAELVREVNFVAEILKEQGVDKIYCLDGHGGDFLNNIDSTKLLPCVELIKYKDWQELTQKGAFDIQMEIGSHARAGTLNGFLDHTFNSRQIFSVKLNGREFSELGVHAVLAGAYNIPIAFVTGDETACSQAKEYVPSIVTAPVKNGTERNSCKAYGNAEENVRSGVQRALESAHSPFVIDFPVTVEYTYYRTDYCEEVLDRIADKSKVERIGARTLRKTVDKIVTMDDLRF